MTGFGNALTMALVHFIWQGALMALLLYIVLLALRNRSANLRYTACCAALAAMAILPVITTWRSLPASAGGRGASYVLMLTDTSLDASAAAVTLLAPKPKTDWQSLARGWILPLWAIGVAIFAARMAWGCSQVTKLRRAGTPANSGLLDIARSLAERMGLGRAVQILTSDKITGPSVVGWLRPVILLPVSAIAGLSPEQLEAILAHELAHIRRYDALVNLCQMAVEAMLFYHPAVWWVSRRMRLERELCCDDLAVRACADAVGYARALTILERMRVESPATALGAANGSLRYRIERITGVARPDYGSPRGIGMMASLLAVAGIAVALQSAWAQQQPSFDYLKQGDVLLRDGRLDDAVRIYAAGQEQDAGHRSTYLKRIIEVLMRQEKRAEAIKVNNQLLKEHPDDADALGLQAAFLVDAGKPGEAVTVLEPLIKRSPDNPVLHLNLARAYAASGQSEGAQKEFEATIAMRPDFTRAVMLYAEFLIEQNHLGTTSQSVAQQDRLAEAQRLLEPLRGRASQSSGVMLALAHLDRMLGQFEKASDDYLKIYEQNPLDARALYSAAKMLIEARQPERAVDLARTQWLHSPERLDLMMTLGDVAVAANQLDVAADTFRQMIAKSGGKRQAVAAAYFRLAQVYRAKGVRQEALESIGKAIELDPSNEGARKLQDQIRSMSAK